LKRAGYLCLLALAVVVVGVAAADISGNIQKYQWDLRVYYYAPVAATLGLDAYNPYVVNQNFGTSVRLPFVYPPLILKALQVLSVFDYETVYQIWLVLKLIALVALFWLWQRRFGADGPLALFLVFTLLAFDAAVYADFKAGNITVFEQLALWLAFLAFIRDRLTLFCVLIVVLAFIKLTPAVFLIVLLFDGSKHRWRYLGLSIAALVVLFLFNYLAWPEMFSSYLRNVMSISERASESNYATLSLLQDDADWFTGHGLSVPTLLPFVVYALIGLAVLIATFVAVKGGGWSRFRTDRRLQVLLISVLFALLMPRMKSYSYMLLIVPGYFLIRNYLPRRLAAGLFVILLLGFHNLGPVGESLGSVALYIPLFAAYLVWWLYLKYAVARPVNPL